MVATRNTTVGAVREIGVAAGTSVSEPPRCGNGHPMTTIRRGSGVRPVCAECLAGAMLGVRTRAERPTVNDFLAHYESGDLPRLKPADAAGAETLIQAAQELYGEPDAATCRRVVRDAARAAGVPVREVMGWELDRLRGAVRKLELVAA